MPTPPYPHAEHLVPSHAIEHRSNNLTKWEYPNAVYQRVLSRYLDRLFHLLASTGARRVLDAGCGEGVVYRAMRERGFRGEWTGVDISEGAVAYARTRSPEAQWLTASLDRLPFAPASFDTVLCSQVLEHVPNPHAALNGMADVSSRRLLVSVPWEPAFRTLTAVSVAVGVGQDPGHVNFWDGARFRRVLGTVGRVVAWERSSVYQLALVDTSRKASA